jgi:hypothetical protein
MPAPECPGFVASRPVWKRGDALPDQGSNPGGGHRLLLARRVQLSAFKRFSFLLRGVEKRALGLLLSGGDFDQAVDEMGATWPGSFSIVVGPTYG